MCFSQSASFLSGSNDRPFKNCICFCFFSVQISQLFQGPAYFCPKGVINVDLFFVFIIYWEKSVLGDNAFCIMH